MLIPPTEIIVKFSDAMDDSLDYLLKSRKNRVAVKIRDTELIDQFIHVDTLPENDRHT